jgi:succinate dehydrogenase / fumarate reductase, membrane anchor subunit
MSHTDSTSTHQAQLQAPLARVRGLGASGTGAHHWWMQRVTSIALLPLTIWFIVAMATNAGMTHAEAVAWIGRPFNAVLLLALVGLTFHHTAAGLQVIIEDYVKAEWPKIALIMVVKGIAWLLGIATVLAVLRIAV